ncbi:MULTISPECIES: glycogen debranching N-terminal domain-containing protein [unclassified Arthrobacter]|uniref:glycogen debranching N-terminal domain-containing protein n=1 Tax=unclassified Arthrobacter TaxID=235627 RepID=UPI00159E130A|nr:MULTISPECIES: glycogen debranching N-terminal domain-containing protein [unclassified Arthrobacter]MCQ9165253.1 amylo-alpha-1,6-glucosidase [Arthrobacter sp. STN4]NVM99551.1 amylo-alpha-1,6-glucosidase [Arthrobacter sp. SDTb3-6]
MSERQPFLHDLNVQLAAPMQAWSGADGQIRPDGAQGIYVADTRVAGEALLTVNGMEPEQLGASGSSFTAAVRDVGGSFADPLLVLVRRRTVEASRVVEEFVLHSDLPGDADVSLELRVGVDFSPMAAVKSGGPRVLVVPVPREDRWEASAGAVTASFAAPGAAGQAVADDGALVFRWDLAVPARGKAEAGWSVEAADGRSPVAAAAAGPRPLEVTARDPRLKALAARAQQDLAGLRMSTVDRPGDAFLAAGAPWFFTLFGRDSIIAARMMLPVDPELAAGTLRTLAARQGRENNAETAEQPGKILHELRRGELVLPGNSHNEQLRLPPVYYGTVDATPLWISLLHDAWRWGMPEDPVRELLGNLEAALGWLRDWGDGDGDGFLEYLDTTGHGLANQGWKDSADSIRWQDGSLARGPIALAEVQGYAYRAALDGAALLDAFGRPGGAQWRSWAASLAERFRAGFWCRDALGPYPAIALDADKRPVDGVASNMGHLLGTGLLSREEEAAVADRLMGPGMFSGFGIRTLDAANAAYWPLRYHCGSVWTHDSALILGGLAAAGHSAAAARVALGLVNAAEGFGYRLPELFSGDAADQGGALPYPSSCRPQAWAAASAVPILLATLGLEPQGPGRLPLAAPKVPTPFGGFSVSGLQAGGLQFKVEVDESGATALRPM